ncbi:hypothetical protein Hanom_Chr07g00671381 [Helianthus anomalus]
MVRTGYSIDPLHVVSFILSVFLSGTECLSVPERNEHIFIQVILRRFAYKWVNLYCKIILKMTKKRTRQTQLSLKVFEVYINRFIRLFKSK